MGFFESGVEKAVTRQKGAIEEEAGKAGCRILENGDLINQEDRARGVLSGSLKALIGGKTKITSIQVFKMSGQGLEFYFFQPFEGLQALPGEYHVLLDGNLPDSLVLSSGVFSNKWKAAADKDLAAAFNADGPLKAATRKLEWSFQAGFSQINLDWTVGLRPAGAGKVHMILRNGRYGGITTYGIGVAVFLSLCAAVGNLVRNGTYNGEKAFVEPASFTGVFEALRAAGN